MRRPESLPANLMVPPGRFPDDLSLRLATAGDLRPLHATFYAQQPYTQFRAHFHRLLRRQEAQLCFWVVVESPAELVGNGQLIVFPHGAELANLQVCESYRNRGIGTAMIHVLTNIATYTGLDSLEIGVALNNERARALYTRLGFVTDRQIQMAGEGPAIILCKTL